MADTMDSYRSLTPYLVVADADAEIRFLTAAFGATEKSVDRRPDGAVLHAEIVVGDSLVMLGQANDTWKALSGALVLTCRAVTAAPTAPRDARPSTSCARGWSRARPSA